MDCLAACFGNKTNNNHTLSDYDKHYFTGTDLGAGAFAVVKKATRKSDGKQFAVKIIDKAKVKGVADVQTEIEVLKKLHHSHIISLIDLFQTNTHYYLIMELATGGELFDRILAKGKYTEKDAASLVKQLLKALNYLHDEVNIVHRDLKPENLIFRDPSETSDLLVTDFGLSKVIQSNEFLKTSSGTPSYVAPEILQESGHGKGVDMWSTGVITYVMLCGYTPFWGGESNSTTILYQSIVKGKYEYEEEYWGMISSEAKDFISKLLVVDPKSRMTAKQALEHPWMATNATADLLPNVRKNFNAKTTFKKVGLAVQLINRSKAAEKKTPPPTTELS